ncbi:hypothetical protein PUN28_017566 [Cardiocondyla obscurior]|uniref:Uncharacterized protein n=1 Tax=Cardiocondyla obscurior TaxID=286306 RepID=A0AAW2EJ56_9HYME
MLPRSGSEISAGDATKEQDRQCIGLACSSIRRQPKRWFHTDESLYLNAWKPRFRVGLSERSKRNIKRLDSAMRVAQHIPKRIPKRIDQKEFQRPECYNRPLFYGYFHLIMEHITEE